MKRSLYLLAILACAKLLSVEAVADVHVTLKLEHVEYLQYEKVNAFVTVYNDEDYRVVIDSKKTNRSDEVRFTIRYGMKDPAVRINRLPVVDYLELKPGEKKTLLIDLTRWYSFSKVGSYDVSVELEHGGRLWKSKRTLVDVVDGIQTASVKRSIPGDPNRIRKYSLRYWSRNRKEYLFMRAEEEESEIVYGVFLLGGLIRIFKPVIDVDRKGNITVLHQSGPNVFTRTTFKSEPYKVKFIDQVYVNEEGVPYRRQNK
jgi:hypothetical protein